MKHITIPISSAMTCRKVGEKIWEITIKCKESASGYGIMNVFERNISNGVIDLGCDPAGSRLVAIEQDEDTVLACIPVIDIVLENAS